LTNSPDELYHVLEAFKPALKSIDVRTVAVCPPSEEHWQNLVTAIFLSDKTVEEIKAEQEKIPQVRNNHFAIFFDAIPFNYLIFDKISNGEIRFPLSSFGTHRIKSREFDPLALKVTSTQEWVNGSLCHSLKAVDQGVLEDRKNLWDIIYQQNTWVKRFGFSSTQQLIAHYLKINNYDHGIRKDFEIVIPQLAKIENVQFSDKQITVNIQKPKQLNGLQLNLQLQRESQIIMREVREIKGTQNFEDFEISELLPFDLLNV